MWSDWKAPRQQVRRPVEPRAVVELATMIDLGSIAFGPELERRRVIPEITRLRGALMPELMPSTIEIVYFIPGSLGEADFEGLQLSRSRAKSRHILVYVDVPRDVAESDEPMPALIDLARSAIEYARGAGSGKSRSATSQSVDFDALLEALNRAAGSILGSSLVPRPRGDRAPVVVEPDAQEAGIQNRDNSQRAGVVVGLRIGNDRSALGAAFALEDELEQRLEATHSGYVDGNEVGQGTFDIYAYGPSLTKLRSEVESLVRHRWTRAGATLRILDGDDRVETLTP